MTALTLDARALEAGHPSENGHTSSNAAIDRVLGKDTNPITAGKATAKIAAGLKHRDHLGSRHAADALVIALTPVESYTGRRAG